MYEHLAKFAKSGAMVQIPEIYKRNTQPIQRSNLTQLPTAELNRLKAQRTAPIPTDDGFDPYSDAARFGTTGQQIKIPQGPPPGQLSEGARNFGAGTLYGPMGGVNIAASGGASLAGRAVNAGKALFNKGNIRGVPPTVARQPIGPTRAPGIKPPVVRNAATQNTGSVLADISQAGTGVANIKPTAGNSNIVRSSFTGPYIPRKYHGGSLPQLANQKPVFPEIGMMRRLRDNIQKVDIPRQRVIPSSGYAEDIASLNKLDASKADILSAYTQDITTNTPKGVVTRGYYNPAASRAVIGPAGTPTTGRHEILHGLVNQAVRSGRPAGLPAYMRPAYYLTPPFAARMHDSRYALSTIANEMGAVYGQGRGLPFLSRIKGPASHLFGEKARIYGPTQTARISPAVGTIQNALGYTYPALTKVAPVGAAVAGGGLMANRLLPNNSNKYSQPQNISVPGVSQYSTQVANNNVAQ